MKRPILSVSPQAFARYVIIFALEPLEWRPRARLSGSPTLVVPSAVSSRPSGQGTTESSTTGEKVSGTKSWSSHTFIPTEVKVGDVVELGGIELGTGALRGYAFQSFLWGTKEHLICSERDVTGIVE